METSFSSLAQRIAYSYPATYPAFAPADSGDATEESQRQMHGFLRDAARKLFEDPSLLSLTAIPDGCYRDWELQSSRPELIEAMRKTAGKIEDFYLLLAKLGDLGAIREDRLFADKAAIKIPPKALAALAGLGLSHEKQSGGILLWSQGYPDMVPAWKLLSAIARESGRESLVFSHGLFNPRHPHSGEIFLSLVKDRAAFQALDSFFDKNKYIRVEDRENGVSIDWVKNYAKKEEPLKASWAERTHGGLSVWYDCRREHPVLFGLRVPMFKELLSRFEDMDNPLKEFVIAKTKKCDGCGYCTQTDKTGNRKRQLVTVSHNGQFDLCLMFPGFSYVWTEVDEMAAEDIIRFLTFTDLVLGQQAKCLE